MARRSVYGMALVAVGVAAIAVLWWRDRDEAALAQGRALYDAHCAACHGINLEGQPNWQERRADGKLPAPPHDVTGHTWHHPDDILFAITKHGLAPFVPPGYVSDMLGFAGVLSDAEIRAVLAYIKSRWPEDIRRRQAALPNQERSSQTR